MSIISTTYLIRILDEYKLLLLLLIITLLLLLLIIELLLLLYSVEMKEFSIGNTPCEIACVGPYADAVNIVLIVHKYKNKINIYNDSII